MSSEKVDRASVVVLLLIAVSVLSVCTADEKKDVNIQLLAMLDVVINSGGRELAQEKIQKDHSTAVSEGGATASGTHPRSLMVKTNDYGGYDPAPAFSKPRFKLIPN